MTSPLHRLTVLGLAIATVSVGTPAAAQLGRFLPGRGNSVDGERGSMLSQVDPAEISQRLGSGAGLAFADEAGNRGEHHGLRLRMPQTEAAIAAMIQQMDTIWPHDPRRPVQVHILASGFYAPTALPDGSILVPLGLLIQVETDDELAYILAHELSHVRLGHFADDQGFRQQRQTGQRLGQAYSIAATLYQMRADASGGGFRTYQADPAQAERERARAAAAANALNVMVNVFAEPAWARSQEDQADALAFDLSEAVGFNGLAGADSAFGRMEADFDLRRSTAVAMEAQLNETAQEALTESNLAAALNGGAGSVVEGLLGSFARRGARRGFQLASGYFGQRHRPPEARSEGLSTYADEAYPDRSGFMDTRDTALLEMRASNEFQQAVIAVDAMQAAQERRLAGDVQGALVEISRAQATSFGRAPAILNAAAAIHADAGDFDEADRLYSQAHTQDDDSLEGHVAHVQMLMRAGRRDRARQVIQQGADRYGGGELGEKAFLPSLIAISLLDGEEQQGIRYLQRCMAYAEESLSRDCTIAATSPGDPQRYDSLSPEARFEIDQTVRTNRTAGADTGFGGLGDAVNSISNLFGRTN